jgi:hypothetical protein
VSGAILAATNAKVGYPHTMQLLNNNTIASAFVDQRGWLRYTSAVDSTNAAFQTAISLSKKALLVTPMILIANNPAMAYQQDSSTTVFTRSTDAVGMDPKTWVETKLPTATGQLVRSIGMVNGRPSVVRLSDTFGVVGTFCRAADALGAGPWTSSTPHADFTGAMLTDLFVAFGVPWYVTARDGAVFRATNANGDAQWTKVTTLWAGDMMTPEMYHCRTNGRFINDVGDFQFIRLFDTVIKSFTTSNGGTAFATQTLSLRAASGVMANCLATLDITSEMFVMACITSGAILVFRGGVTEHHTLLCQS